MKKRLIIIGASGHGKVLLDIALRNEYEVLGFLDDYSEAEEIAGYPILGKTSDAEKYKDEAGFIVAIGSNVVRKMIAETYDLNWETLIHPQAVIGMGVSIGAGTVVMANAVINPFAEIGKHRIVNTSCVIEHDNRIADYVHISPGAVLAGTVTIEKLTHIGVNAVVRNNVAITSECVVGAGAAVVTNIVEKGIYAGVPARRIMG